ncbi:MAG: 3-hydroxyacyl-CoA dehydrogenase [Hyphomicrobiales bacterium]|nr:3-hydroxyacyl-CoA dehydrogenase [Hyphomicrobiales bacterium]MBV8769094.1 3-hydroxyacyl-CoA dehydrogenase [Hyphomicrobiales bacterium]MBV9138738.1 3-hydroxyacyl-CoA dehydrogenase [Hyphomicrobiales bacterium]MBV9588743.1 3-hydroxyacyl-CoA dehydrogenase [Hyphomicrobiales bacterium]MBV9974071.1 3-hydroxyacyl-CoA dehydrogenase [Hyphomicrobiales bacterium]
MSTVAVIGTGFIGRAWAISFARAGHDITLWDEDRAATDRAVEFIADVLPDLAANDLLGGATPAELLGRLHITRDLAGALMGAVHVQENAPERVDVKKALFAKLDRLAPEDAVIASSTSAILPSRFTGELAGRHRCLIIHPINPPYLIPAAEIVPAPWTSADVVKRARDFLIAAGQAPIVMKRELDGFVMNRMQGALLEEAFRLVADGYASVEDVDVGIREGLALRWSFMGPFETIDLNAPGGVRDYVERYHNIYKILFAQMQRRIDWEGNVLDEIERARRVELPAAQLAERQLWRDRRLMALAAHKRRANRDIGD